jgi:hypothetical protein
MSPLLDMADDLFVNLALLKLDESGVAILNLHRGESFPPEAVLMTADQFEKIMRLVPPSEEATALVMDHEHLTGDEG